MKLEEISNFDEMEEYVKGNFEEFEKRRKHLVDKYQEFSSKNYQKGIGPLQTANNSFRELKEYLWCYEEK